VFLLSIGFVEVSVAHFELSDKFRTTELQSILYDTSSLETVIIGYLIQMHLHVMTFDRLRK